MEPPDPQPPRRPPDRTHHRPGRCRRPLTSSWILSGFYDVQRYEEAIVTRFGAYERTETPGLRYHLPVPIEQAELVDVTNDQRMVDWRRGGAVR